MNYERKRKKNTNERKPTRLYYLHKCFHSLVRVLDVSFQDFCPSIGFDAVLDVVASEREERLGSYHSQHQIEPGQPGKQPLTG